MHTYIWKKSEGQKKVASRASHMPFVVKAVLKMCVLYL